MLRRAERFTDIAEQVVTHLPKSKAMRDAITRVDRDKARVDFVKRYSDLYGMYTETEVVYTDDRTLALFESPERTGQGDVPVRRRHGRLEVLPQGRALAGGDAEPARAVQARPREAEGPDPRARGAGGGRLRHGGHDHHLQRRRVLRVGAHGRPRAGRVARGARRACSRGSPATCRSTGATGATSCGRSSGGTRARAWRGSTGSCANHVGEFMLQKASAAAIRRVREHRAAGHRTILITAAAEPFVRPLAPLFDVVIGAELQAKRRPLHRLHVAAAAGGRGARRLAEALRARWRAST